MYNNLSQKCIYDLFTCKPRSHLKYRVQQVRKIVLPVLPLVSFSFFFFLKKKKKKKGFCYCNHLVVSADLLISGVFAGFLSIANCLTRIWNEAVIFSWAAHVFEGHRICPSPVSERGDLTRLAVGSNHFTPVSDYCSMCQSYMACVKTARGN